jgi:hypothetical protein
LYRFSIGRPREIPNIFELADDQQNAILRYGVIRQIANLRYFRSETKGLFPFKGKRLELIVQSQSRLSPMMVTIATPAMMCVPIAHRYERAMHPIIVVMNDDGRRGTIIRNHNRRFADGRGDCHLRDTVIRLRDHDRRWTSDHQPGRGRQRESNS